MNIEEQILKYLHDIFPDIRIFPSQIDFLNELGLDSEKDLLEFEKAFDHLIEDGYIEGENLKISISISGIFYYEQKYLYPNLYFLKAIKILLEFFESLENGEYENYLIANSEIIDKLKKEDIIMDNKEFFQFLITLEHKADLFKNIGPFGILEEHEIRAYSKNRPILTPYARDFLKNWRYKHELFKNVKDPLIKEILLEEYYSLQKIIEQNLWKDAFIKIGGILEFLLVKWLQIKGLTPSQIAGIKITKWRKVKFYQMIDYYMNNVKNYSEEIGPYTHWNVVKNILKDYRNYVHLLKYEERVKVGDFLRKEEFDLIFPTFQDIIIKF